jgi:hypothetical protein
VTPEAEVELQNLWLALQKKTWRVLAVVPAMRDLASFDVASAIAEVAWQYRSEPTVVLDLRDITLRLVDYHKKEIDEHVQRGECVIIALSSILHNPTTISLTKSADTAILVVRLGETPMKAALRTVEEIGPEKFTGTILSRKKPQIAPAPAPTAEKAKEKDKGKQNPKDKEKTLPNKGGSTLIGVGVPVGAPVASPVGKEPVRQTVKMPARGGAK